MFVSMQCVCSSFCPAFTVVILLPLLRFWILCFFYVIVLLSFIILVWIAESSFRKQGNFFFALRQKQGKTAKLISENNFVLILEESMWNYSCRKSLRRVSDKLEFSQNIFCFYPPSHLTKIHFHVSTTAVYFSLALTNTVLLISMANSPAKIVVPACHWSWWWMLASLVDQRQELIFQWEMRCDR